MTNCSHLVISLTFVVLPVDSILCKEATMNRKDEGSSSNNYRVALSTLGGGVHWLAKVAQRPARAAPFGHFAP
jgi:hypothetical protein